ncbi:MAG: flagellar filament capping protein FliD [Deltaproteobacteria bacterium]|nr:flagellar filament capping protein FliD [Deltaproteobacteria bacterium]
MAGTISFDGLATGIKTTDTVDKLMVVESRPKILKEAEQTRLENRQSAWQDVNAKLLAVSVASSDLSRLATWNAQKVTSSNEALLTATASMDASQGTYTVHVERLAKAHQVASQGYDSNTSSVGTGTLSIQLGTDAAKTITFDATNNTLDGAVKAINDAKVGATASIIYDGSQYKVLLSSNETGTKNELTITKGADVTLNFATTVQDAQDSRVTLGSSGAIAVDSASNKVDTLIKGVILNLKAAEPGNEITISVSRSGDEISKKVQAFVDAYNDAQSYISKQFAYDADKDVAGILMGDSTLISMQRNLGGLLLGTVNSGSALKTLSAAGVTIGDGGQLSFNAAKFSEAVASDFTGTMRLFRTGGDSTRSKISFVYAGAKVQESAAGYAVEVTRAATRATVAAGSAAALTIGETTNTITLSVDGSASLSVTLGAGTYTAAELSKEIESKINAAIGRAGVSVTADGDGKLSIASGRYGSLSKVTLSGGTALPSLGFAAGQSASGQDVAGTIDGEAATGTGQILKGNPGNAKTDGLQLLVELSEADVPVGQTATSTVTVTKGVFSRLDEYLSGLTDPLSGAASLRQKGTSSAIDSIKAEIKAMEVRLDAKRESLLAQFRAMESAIGKLNTQGSYLTNALAALTKSSS